MALTKTPIELSSTPSIVDGGNATAITIDSSENVGIGNNIMSSMFSTAQNLVVGTGSGHNGITVYSQSDSVGDIAFADAASDPAYYSGLIRYDHSVDAMRFFTASTERMRILSTGGITFNGDTAQANALNDYEEGTFTPDLSFGGVSAGVSWNIQAGKYTKIGNLVTVSVYLYESTGRGSQTGNATVNIPFNLSSSQPDHWIPISNRQGITAGSNKTLTLFGNAGDALFRFYAGDNSGGNNAGLTHTAFSASGGFEVSFTVTYRTDA